MKEKQMLALILVILVTEIPWAIIAVEISWFFTYLWTDQYFPGIRNFLKVLSNLELLASHKRRWYQIFNLTTKKDRIF